MRLYTQGALEAATDAVTRNATVQVFGVSFRVIRLEAFTKGFASDGATGLVTLKEVVAADPALPSNYRTS